MTEYEAIELCKEMAKRRGIELGLNVSASLNQAELASQDGSPTTIPFRHWSVVFWEGFDQEQYFTVNDLTHHVTWKNQPPPKWSERLLLYLVLYPYCWLLIALEYVFEPWYRGWKNFRLPRCPHCHAKLRTNRSKQCFSCGKVWHHPTDQYR